MGDTVFVHRRAIAKIPEMTFRRSAGGHYRVELNRIAGKILYREFGVAGGALRLCFKTEC